MTKIDRTDAAIQAVAGKAQTHGGAVLDLIGPLDSAVAPALRPDVPEYGVIDSLWNDARNGMKDAAHQLDRTAAKAKAYAAVAEIAEKKWKTTLHDVFDELKNMGLKAVEHKAKKTAAKALEAAAKAEAARKESSKRGGMKQSQKRNNGKARKGTKQRANTASRDSKAAKAEAEAAEKSAAKWGRLAKGAKLADHSLSFVSGASDGAMSQWDRDSKKHPHMGTKTKAARAATVAAASGGGAVAGAEAGAAAGLWGGGAIGTFICPGPGTAVGAFIGGVGGGVVGGAAGSKAGQWAGSKVVDSGHAVDSAAHAAGSGAKKVGHFVTHPHVPW